MTNGILNRLRLLLCERFFHIANIYCGIAVEFEHTKSCTLNKYLPYTVQCRSVIDVKVNYCILVYIYSNGLGEAIECKKYSGSTMKKGTQQKTVHFTLKIFAVYWTFETWRCLALFDSLLLSGTWRGLKPTEKYISHVRELTSRR